MNEILHCFIVLSHILCFWRNTKLHFPFSPQLQAENSIFHVNDSDFRITLGIKYENFSTSTSWPWLSVCCATHSSFVLQASACFNIIVLWRSGILHSSGYFIWSETFMWHTTETCNCIEDMWRSEESWSGEWIVGGAGKMADNSVFRFQENWLKWTIIKIPRLH